MAHFILVDNLGFSWNVNRVCLTITEDFNPLASYRKQGDKSPCTPYFKGSNNPQITKSSIAAANGPHIEAIGLSVAAHEAIAQAHAQADVGGTGIGSTRPIEAGPHIIKSITF